MKWTRERLEDCANHYKQCVTYQREGYTPLTSWRKWKIVVRPPE